MLDLVVLQINGQKIREKVRIFDLVDFSIFHVASLLSDGPNFVYQPYIATDFNDNILRTAQLPMRHR